MARKYLGDTFDIHGGGVDLRFPTTRTIGPVHLCRTRFRVNYWLHNGWVTDGAARR